MIIVLSGPSGSGKSTLVAKLLQSAAGFCESISYTTRTIRNSEESGVDYYYVSEDEFDKMVEQGQFIEWVRIYNNRYGTSAEKLQQMVAEKKDVVFDIDTAGALNIKKLFPESILIYILPPTLEILKKRLADRRTEDEETINLRFSNARKEIVFAGKYDYLIFNDELEKAFATLNSIIIAEKCRIKNNIEPLNKFEE